MEVKRVRSTSCGDLTHRSSVASCNQNTQSWNRLPLEIAENIYRFMPMNDKYNMSLTCKFWSSVFTHPGIWRYSNCTFSLNCSGRRQIPNEILLSLQHVTIDCSVPRNTEKMKKIQRLKEFFVGLHSSKNITLKSLDMVNMKDLGTHLEIRELHHDLSTILAEQTKLSRLSLCNAALHLAFGLELLTAAGLNSHQSLKYVNLQNFCMLTNPVEYDLMFSVIVGQFTNLTELSLNCGFMSDDLLNHLSGTLKLIIVWVYWPDVAWYQMYPTYSSDGWNVLVSKCTGLKAEYHIDNLAGHMEIGPSLVLLPEVPLATFHWLTRGGPQSIIRPCFDEIINTFKNGLQHLHVDFGCQIISERDVAAVVERCPLLQTFSMNGTSVPLKEATAPVEKIVV